ncbi:UNVERIFIED_CONTAM: hypothetical protein Sindi_0097500 [Sesamum indicum]
MYLCGTFAKRNDNYKSETQTPFLGFSRNERSRINISPDSHISPAINDNDGSVEIAETVLKERNTILSTEPLTLEAPPKLGFRPSSSNNGGLEEEPFNLDEFLRLAHAIIDEGDKNAIMALRELKSKWTKRFRSKSHSLTDLGEAPPMVASLRRALRRMKPVRTVSTSENRGMITTS